MKPDYAETVRLLYRRNITTAVDIYATAPADGIFSILQCRSAADGYGQTDAWINGGFFFHSQHNDCNSWNGLAAKGDVLRLHIYTGRVSSLDVYFTPFKKG